MHDWDEQAVTVLKVERIQMKSAIADGNYQPWTTRHIVTVERPGGQEATVTDTYVDWVGREPDGMFIGHTASPRDAVALASQWDGYDNKVSRGISLAGPVTSKAEFARDEEVVVARITTELSVVDGREVGLPSLLLTGEEEHGRSLSVTLVYRDAEERDRAFYRFLGLSPELQVRA